MKKKAPSQLRAGLSRNRHVVPGRIKAGRAIGPKSTGDSVIIPFSLDNPTFEPSPIDLLQRLSAIPLLFDSRVPAKGVPANLSDDSWATGERVGLRDVVDGNTRRMAFRAGQYRFELVAEKRSQTWEFIGRVYHRGRALNDMVLILGRRRLSPGLGGFFHWSSKSVVRQMVLVSPVECFTLENIIW